MPASSYRPPPWLPGAHLQTIWPATFAPRPSIAWRRERWDTPDGDFVDVDFADPSLPGASRDTRPPQSIHAGAADPAPSGTPLLVLFHGLEGSSRSHYARAFADAALRRGWPLAVPHFRGCSGELNRAPRAYHSGDSAEIDWMLRRFARLRGSASPIAAIGVSLGGNVLLKWLGEQREAAGFVCAAVAVSPPQDLHASAVALSVGDNRLPRCARASGPCTASIARSRRSPILTSKAPASDAIHARSLARVPALTTTRNQLSVM